MRMIDLKPFAHAAQLLEDDAGIRRRDDNSRNRVHNVRGDSSAVQRGELGKAEALLMARAQTLNTTFARCATVASLTPQGWSRRRHGASPPPGAEGALTGTWRGTVTIQVNPGDPNPPAPMSGDITWTFEVAPQTNMLSLRATIRSTHPWLTMETTDRRRCRQATVLPRRSALTVSSILRAAVAEPLGASEPPKRHGSRRTSLVPTVSSRRSGVESC